MPVEKIDAKITLTPTQIGELVKAANAPSPTIFEKIAMRGFKVSGEDVRKLSTMFSTAQAIVGAIGTITGAYSTINSALKLIGVLEPDDPFKEARELINSWFVDMRDYYQDRE